MRTHELEALLRKRHPSNAWALFFGVPDATGLAASRTADAVAMSLWPSRGLEVHGFELKVSRSDWLRELKKPQKAEAVYRYCDRWWLVAGEDDVAQVDEIPATWGLLVARAGKLARVKEAPKLEPQAVTREFLASLLRRGAGPGEATLHEIERQAREEGHKAGESYGRSECRRLLDEAQAKIAAFEQASGVKIGASWDAGRIGKAVRRVLEEGDPAALEARVSTALRVARASVQRVLEQIDRQLAPEPEPVVEAGSVEEAP